MNINTELITVIITHTCDPVYNDYENIVGYNSVTTEERTLTRAEYEELLLHECDNENITIIRK